MRETRTTGVAVAALALAAAVVSTPASAADVCISAAAKSTLAQCPAGKLATTMGKKPEVSFKQAPKAIELKKKGDMTKPKNPTDMAKAAQRDERQVRLAARSLQLLVTEIQGLESLLAQTPKKSSDRPKLLRRLAEGYVELESAAFRDKTENQIKADANRKNPKVAAKFRNNAAKSNKMLLAARDAAIKHYKNLSSQHPKWCQNVNASDPAKSTGCGDEVLYYLAYEYEQAQKLDDARKVYLKLIEKWPSSKFIPNAYLAFGELFFQEAQGDPTKWDFAQQSYEKVTGYDPPDNKVWGYAHYKLGYVAWNKGEFPKAISQFKKVIEYGAKYSSLPNAKELANSSRKDIIPVYALSGDPKKAYEFLHPLSGDAGTSNEKTFKMMDDLGQNYLDTGHYDEGIILYTDLMGRDRGPRYCVYQSKIAEATLAKKSGNKDSIMGELAKMMEVHNGFQKEGHPADAKLKCSNATAGLLTESAMAWHLEAVGTGGVRGTGDKKTMALAAQLYDKVVTNFKQEQFAKFEFPRIIKEDWPNIFKIKYAMADLLYFQKDWAKCGPAFDSVVAEDPNGPEAPAAAYASVLCYQNIYTEQHKDGSDKKGNKDNLPQGAGGDGKAKDAKDSKATKAKFDKKTLTDNQKGMLTAFSRYLCYIKPKGGDKEAENNYVEVKFARGRTYYEAQHWEEAAAAFRDIALNHSSHDSGIYAAQFYLESLNIIGNNSDPPRPSCYDDMANDVPKFVEAFCGGDKAKSNADQCGTLTRIQRDIEGLRAQKLVEAADKGGAVAVKQYEKAAEAYMGLWKKYGEGPCERKEMAACEKNEIILYNAARAYQAARLIAKAISVRKILINPKYNLNNTEPAKKAIYEIGGNYQAIAVYDEAANWYEKFASENPKMEKAAESLSDAVVLRLGLGQEKEAIQDAEIFNRNYGASKPAATAQIAFAIGAHYADREDWREAQKRLSSAMKLIDQNATFDVQVQAHALLGRVQSKVGTAANAASEYNKVRAAWKDSGAGIKKVEAVGGSKDEQLRRLVKVLTAVGEAHFYFAEQKRKDVDKIAFPIYKGAGNREDVLKHITTKVKDWMVKKKGAIEATEKEYLKVVQLEPAPPPKWVIASGSRVGQMWGKFVAEFRAAPIPKEWKGSGVVPGAGDLTYEEIRGTYYASIDEASEPQKQRAKGAYKTCLDYSVKYQFFDDYSRKCEEWLSKNYAAEYHAIDEFRGSPSRVNSGLSDRAMPLNIDGTPFRIEVPRTAETPPPASAPGKPAAGGKKTGK